MPTIPQLPAETTLKPGTSVAAFDPTTGETVALAATALQGTNVPPASALLLGSNSSSVFQPVSLDAATLQITSGTLAPITNVAGGLVKTDAGNTISAQLVAPSFPSVTITGRSLASTREDVIYALDLNNGVAPDGTSDWAVLLNSAILDLYNRGGGTLYIPNVNGLAYMLSTPLVFYPNVNIIGQMMPTLQLMAGVANPVGWSAYSSTLWTGSTSGVPSDLQNGSYNLLIQNIIFDGNSANQTNTNFDWQCGLAIIANYFRLKDVIVNNVVSHQYRTNTAPKAQNPYAATYESMVENIRGDGAGGHGWWFQGPHDLKGQDILINNVNTSGGTYYGVLLDTSYAANENPNCRLWHVHVENSNFTGSGPYTQPVAGICLNTSNNYLEHPICDRCPISVIDNGGSNTIVGGDLIANNDTNKLPITNGSAMIQLNAAGSIVAFNHMNMEVFFGGSYAAEALSNLSWASGIVTATALAAHGFPNGQVVWLTIAGATPSGYNGTFPCTSTGTTTFTYALSSNPGTETAAGTYQVTGVGAQSAIGFGTTGSAAKGNYTIGNVVSNANNQAPVNFSNSQGSNYAHVRGTANSPTWTAFPTAPNESSGDIIDMEMSGGGASVSLVYRSPQLGLTGWSGSSSATGTQIAGVGYVANGSISNTGFLNWPAINGGGKGIAIGRVPDGTKTGGNQPGLNAFDAQTIWGNTSSQVASGESAVLIGAENCTADGNFSWVSGNSGAALGRDYTILRSSGQYSGGHQHIGYVGPFRGQTTGTGTTRLLAGSGTAAANNVFPCQANGSMTFDLRLTVQQNGAANECATYVLDGVTLTMGATASTLQLWVNGAQVTSSFTLTPKNQVGLSGLGAVTLAADTTLGALNLSCTGIASTTLHWIAGFFNVVEST